MKTFFEELLKEKTIVVPGIFFDINPSHRRDLFASPCHHYVRISFGPAVETLDKGGCTFSSPGWGYDSLRSYVGLDAIERVLHRANTMGMRHFGHGYRRSLDMTPASHDVHT